MNIKTARRMVLLFMALSVLMALVGLIFFEPGTTVSMYVTMLAFVLMVLALVFLFGFCKCPWCGRRITTGLMKIEVCPHCRRDLETGMKRKGKRK